MKILVFGHNGQLAQSLSLLQQRDPSLRIETRGRGQCDIRNGDAVKRAIDEIAPDAVVNAAAYTAVDKAETEEAAAYEINAIGARHIAAAVNAADIPLVHISTDYVFDGRMQRPYLESDLPFPQGAYGRTKLAGEYAVRHCAPRSVVLRTAWVFSEFGANFVKTMLRLAAERDRLTVVDDQIGNPTYAPEIAKALVTIGQAMVTRKRPCPQVMNFSGGQEMSWYEFAMRIMAAAARHGLKSVPVTPIPSSAYPTPAVRPANSRLNNGLIREQLDIHHKDVDACLDIVLESISPQSTRSQTEARGT